MPGVLKGQRTKAIESSRALRYFFYAVGEVLLIFVGITLAVALENSAEQRREAEVAEGLLTGLRESLRSNVAEFERSNADDRQFLAAIDVVLGHFASADGWHDSISAPLDSAFYWALPNLSTAGYRSLEQAGFGLVPDPVLVSAIVDLFDVTHGNLLQYERVLWTFMEAVHLPYRTREVVSVQGHSRPRDYRLMRERGELRTILLEHQRSLRLAIEYRTAATEETETVLGLISDYLAQDP